MTKQADNTPPLDDETQRLLDELEGDAKADDAKADDAKADDAKADDAKADDAKADDAKAAPKKKTASKSKAKSKTTKPKDTASPAAKPKKGSRLTITNVSKNHRRICRVDLAVGDSYTLTADDLKDERLMAKLQRAIDLGVLSSDCD